MPWRKIRQGRVLRSAEVRDSKVKGWLQYFTEQSGKVYKRVIFEQKLVGGKDPDIQISEG